MSEINASAVKKMKVTDLRSELTKRGLDTKGLKQVLVDRLLAALEDDQPVEMATEVKEEPEEEPTEVAENGQVVKTEPKDQIEEVAQQPPDELMAEDTTVPDEKNDEPAVKEEPIDETEPVDEQENKADEPETMESEEKDQEAVETENDKQDSIMQDADEEEKFEEQEEKSEEQEEKSEEQEKKSEEQEKKSEEQEEKSEEQEEKSEEQMPKKEKKRESLLEVEEEKDETEDSSVVLSRYVSDLYFKISPDGLMGSVITDEGFTYIWAGAKTTWGVNKGKVCYECKVLKNVENDLPDTEEPKNGVRVGWSVAGSGLQLGEEGLSYGFENTGKSCTASEFSEYGASYTQGDVIGCYLDLESEEATISYTKNGEDLGVAFTIPKEDLADKVLYPHIIVKNTECQINTGVQDDASFPFPTKEGYTLIQQVGNENLVEGPRGAKEKEDCEVLMMVGLPASGKTTWVNKHVGDEKEKNYNIIGTNSVMAKMKVNGEERKRSSENYDKLMEKATRCLRRIFELAPTKKRNYILDQTNVHPNAQKRKMESFSGFKRIAVVVCPKPEELDKRTKEKKEKKGFEVPEFALNDMKANFTLPRVGPLFTEVNFIEEDEEESGKIVADYKRNARSSHNRGGNRRRDDHHKGGSGRFHPYKRDDHRSNRGGGGNRDRRSGGRGGGGSNYGRQHGGSHDRRSGGGNKGYQNYNRGGGNRSGGGGNRTGGGNFQKNYNQYQQPQQIQQQRYAGYAATPQYSFPQQPAYPGYQNPYQQPRAAYPAAAYQQQQQAYYYQQQAQQNYYQQAGYGQQAAYGQYPRRY